MRLLLQRVSRAEVRVGERVTGRIATGYLLLVGLTHDDDDAKLVWMADKIVGLRLFSDAEGKMNLSIDEVGGAVLCYRWSDRSISRLSRQMLQDLPYLPLHRQ